MVLNVNAQPLISISLQSLTHHPESLIPQIKHLFFSSSSTLYEPPSNDGAGLYQFWCSTCHGDRGQGLTPEWRATWPKDKQNCWQAKCHSSSHPRDGFTIPKNVPALIGLDTLRKFNTAQDLYGYMSAAMPYWSPNLLKDNEYRAITVFLVEANYQARGYPASITLSGDWSTFLLHPESKTVDQPIVKVANSSLQPNNSSLPPTSGLWLWLLPLIIGVIIIFPLARRLLFQAR